MNPGEDEAVRVVSEIEGNLRREELKRLSSRLLQSPSYQTDLYEMEPTILKFVKEVVEPELRARGVTDITIDPMGNLIARVGSKRGGPSLMLLGYAMTAAAGTMKEPFSGEILAGTEYGYPGEIVWGRGACEQKASLAAAIEAMYVISRSPEGPAGEVVFVLSTAGETGRHDSLREVVEVDAVRTDAAIVTLGEPSIQLGHKGRVDVEVRVEGKACHSSTPWDGVNAIDGMALVMERLRGLSGASGISGAPAHPVLGRATLTSTGVESFPKATHTVQSSCVLRLDRRLLPGDDPSLALEEIVRAIGTMEPRYKVRVSSGAFMYPSEVSRDSTIARLLASAVRRTLGREPEYSYMHAAIDTGYLNVMGIQAANFGAGNMRLAHTDNDYASIEDIVGATKVYSYAALAGVES